MEDIFLVLTKE